MPDYFKRRLTFSKQSRARFISHLDLMRCFQRSFRRAGIMLRHSEGFNPHPYLSILVPLSVGYESECELLDFQLYENAPCADLAFSLSRMLPEGITADFCREPVRPVRDLAFARYRVLMKFSEDSDLRLRLESLFKSNDIIVSKKSKSGVSDVNLGALIRRLEISGGDGEARFIAELPSAVNPSLIEAAVRKYLPEAQISDCRYKRTAFLLSDGSQFL